MLPPSARPEGQLTLSRWPGSFCPPSPHSYPSYSECIAKTASQSTLTVWKVHSRSFHPSHTLSNCCIGVACVTHECLTILAQTLSLCLFVRASVLQSTECWTLTCPIPASLSFTVPVFCTKNENSYQESFCLYGGDTSRKTPSPLPSPPPSLGRIHPNLCLMIALIDCWTTIWSVPPWGQIWFCVAFYFGLAVLLVALLTHTQLQLNLKVCLSVSQWTQPLVPWLRAQWKGGKLRYMK